MDLTCNKQSLWHPLERAKKYSFCNAICESTGRQCKNLINRSVYGAFVVLDIVDCCHLCGMHARKAEVLLKDLYVVVGTKVLIKLINASVPKLARPCVIDDVDMMTGERLQTCQVDWGAYANRTLQNIQNMRNR